MGNTVGAFLTHPFNLVSLFVYGTIYSIVPMIKQDGKFPNSIYPATILISGMSFSLVMLFVVLAYYENNYVWIFTMISFLCRRYLKKY